MSDMKPQRALVVGGSYGGLTAALLLREAGFEVDLFERTPTFLDGRGSGIVLQPDTVRWLTERHPEFSLEEVSTGSECIRYTGAGNEIVHEESAEWRFTSWATPYRSLLKDFGTDSYHLGEFAVGVDQDADGVEVRFVSGRREQADLVVFADGISSTARRRLMPDVHPEYSGYVGWRGTVPETHLTAETHALLDDALGYSLGPYTHICMYMIPGPAGEVERGERQFNYVWYRNAPEGQSLDELLTDKHGLVAPVSVPPGQVQDRFVAEMKADVTRELSPAAAELVTKTPEPYLQVVLDIEVPQMAFGRIALLGDAAFVARPHAAGGTAKAAADAWALTESLRANDNDVPRALRTWEPGQLALGRQLVERNRSMGTRAQALGTWDPADPSLHFGLYGPDK